MVTVDTLQIEIQDNSEKAASGIAKLCAQLAGLRAISNGGYGLSKTNKDLQAIVATIQSIPSLNIGNLVSDASPQIDMVKASVESVGDSLANLGADTSLSEAVSDAIPVINETKDAVSELKSEFDNLGTNNGLSQSVAGAIPAINQTRDAVSSVSDEVSNLGANSGFSDLASNAGAQPEASMKSLQSAIKQVIGGFGNLASGSEQTAMSVISSIMQIIPAIITIGTTTATTLATINTVSGVIGVIAMAVMAIVSMVQLLSKKTKDATKETKKLKTATEGAQSGFSKFIASIGRILMYRVIRKMFSEITSGIKEGMQNLVRYSEEANAAMSSLSTSTLYLKNSFAAMISPLLSSVLPALKTLINIAVTAANAVNQLISALMGKSVFIKAKEYAVDYAGGLDSATGSANDLKDALAGFDELNIISPPSAGGGGGGYDYSEMFEEAEIDSKFLDIIEKVKKILQDIKNIAQPTVNSLKDLWETLRRIGKEFIWESLKDFYYEFLLPVATWTMGEGIPRFLDAIREMLNGVDWDSLREALKLVWKALEPFAEEIGEGLLWFFEEVIGPFGTWIIGTALPVVLKLIAKALELVLAVWGRLKPILMELWETYIKPFAQTTGALIIDIIEKIIATIDWLLNDGRWLLDLIIDLAVAWLAMKAVKSADEFSLIVAAIVLLIPKIKEIIEKWNEFKDKISEVLGKVKEIFGDGEGGIKGILEKCKTFIKEKITDPIAGFFTGLWDDIKTGAKTMAYGVVASVVGMANNMITGINTMLESVLTMFNSLIAQLNKIDGVNIPTLSISIPLITVPDIGEFAQGGFPESGEYFLARENGIPEMVGSFGGRTAVANNDQIVEGIASGVSRAMQEENELMREQNGLLRNILEKTGVYLDGKQLMGSVEKAQTERGSTFLPGGALFGL